MTTPPNPNSIYIHSEGRSYLNARTGAVSERVQGLRASLFEDLSGSGQIILDFGCGTGGVVARLPAAKRIGVEIGKASAEVARSAGIEVYDSLSAVNDNSVDVVISFHALEHVDSPIDIVKEIRRVLKTGGVARIIVPAESVYDQIHQAWRENPDMHLHTWTPLNIGNLAHRVGGTHIVTKVEPMPTRSRLVSILRFIPPAQRVARYMLQRHRNSMNVILEFSKT